MTIFEALRNFWAESGATTLRMELGALPAGREAAALVPMGGPEILEAYADGARLTRYRYKLLFRLYFGHEMAFQKQALESMNLLCTWRGEQLPVLPEGMTALDMQLTKAAEVLSCGDDFAVLGQEWAVDVLEAGSGSSTQFAGRALDEFSGHLVRIEDQGCRAEVVFIGGTSLKMLKNSRAERTMRFVIDFIGSNQAQAQMYVTDFSRLFMADTPVELEPDDGYSYRAVLVESEQQVAKTKGVISMTFTFRAVRHGDLITIAGNTGTYPSCVSSYPRTDCRLTIPLSAISNRNADLQIILGQQAWTIAAPINGNIVIDGIEKTITMGGNNCASKTAWVDFPWLRPSTNVLTVKSGGTAFVCNYTLEYEPIFV